MADIKWIKITTDMFENRKIRYLRKQPQGDSIVLIWVMLLTLAGRSNAGGAIYLTDGIPYTVKMLADELEFKPNTILAAITALQKCNMVDIRDDVIVISGWDEHQNENRLAEIRAKDRERKKQKKEQENAETFHGNSTEIPRKFHGTKTEFERNLNGKNAEIPYIEKEEEEEKEEYIHSFIPIAREEKEGVEKPVENSLENSEIKQELLGGSLGKGVVMLSQEQINDLLDKLSIDEFNKYVGIVAECELGGKSLKRKTHYQAILDMVSKDRKIKK